MGRGGGGIVTAVPWLAALLFFASLSGVAWYFLSSARPASGGTGLLARWRAAKRRRAFDDGLPAALATMSNALRAGFSLSQAFDSVVESGEEPVAGEFAILQRQIRVGMGLEEALESMATRTGSDDFALVAAATLASRKSGGNVTEIFDSIAETVRERMRVERKVRSLTAQGRLQGAVVSAMPLVLGVALLLLKPGMMVPFLCSIYGVVSLIAVAVLIGAGWLIIGKITRIDV